MIIGGSMDSEANALTVVPCGRSPTIVVTMLTGAHTRDITSRNDVASTGGAMVFICSILSVTELSPWRRATT
jgi:hypothetical protein